MRPLLAAAVLFPAALALLAAVPASRAQDDPRKEARLLYVEGKFADAEKVLAAAGADVANDADLRVQLAEIAQKALRNKTGEERRGALDAVRRCLGAVATARPEDVKSMAGALDAAKEVAALDVAAKKPDAAKALAQWSIDLGEKAPAEALGVLGSIALGDAYLLRANVSKRPDAVDAVCADFDRAAVRYEAAAAAAPEPAEALARAATTRFDAARFVHDTIPIESETRDETYLQAAVETAAKAVASKGASEGHHALYLKIALLAHEWKLPGNRPAPAVAAMSPPYEGLSLKVPRGGSWKAQPKTPEWDVIFERKFEGDVNAVQVMVTSRSAKSLIGGKQWAQTDEAAKTQFESLKSPFSEGLATETPPTRLGGKKGEVWFFEVGGMRPDLKRPQRIVEFLWVSSTRKDVVWDLKIVDWRRPSSIEDPDLVAFVASAIGEGLWPPGAAAPPHDDGKKKPPPKKK